MSAKTVNSFFCFVAEEQPFPSVFSPIYSSADQKERQRVCELVTPAISFRQAIDPGRHPPAVASDCGASELRHSPTKFAIRDFSLFIEGATGGVLGPLVKIDMTLPSPVKKIL